MTAWMQMWMFWGREAEWKIWPLALIYSSAVGAFRNAVALSACLGRLAEVWHILVEVDQDALPVRSFVAVSGSSPGDCDLHKKRGETCRQIYGQKWAETRMDSHIGTDLAGHTSAVDRWAVRSAAAGCKSVPGGKQEQGWHTDFAGKLGLAGNCKWELVERWLQMCSTA